MCDRFIDFANGHDRIRQRDIITWYLIGVKLIEKVH